MLFQLPFVATLMGVALAASPSKPAANPEIPFWTVTREIESFLKKVPKYEKGYWLPNGLPQGCKDVATAMKMNPKDFKVFNVKYEDCDQPWVFCRHKDADTSEQSMIEKFGRIPVQMRSFVRHYVASPNVTWAAAWTWSTGDILIEQNPEFWTLLHEISHSMDANAQDTTFSQSATWQNAYAKDSNTVTEYGKSSWAEDFAESNVVAFYNHNIDRGIGKIVPNWRQFANQKETAEKYFGKYMVPGGKCGKRLANTPKVPMSSSAKMAALAQVEEDPDTKVTWEGIEEIVPKKELEGQVIGVAQPQPEQE